MLLYLFFHSDESGNAVFPFREGGEPHKSLSASAETDAGSADHLTLLQQVVEECP
jgi:hypothetical protein